MNVRFFVPHLAGYPARSGIWMVIGPLAAVSLLGLADLRAQDPVPAPTPVSTPAPAPAPGDTPAPAPTPGGGGTSAPVTITPGLPSAATVAAYNAARTPQATVVLSTDPQPVSSPQPAPDEATTVTAATAAVSPSARDGVGSLVRFPAPAASKVSRTTTAATASAQPPTAAVTLAYNASYAGQLVWVQPLNGGTLSADAGTGTPYTTQEGFYLTLAADGTAAFSYQPPAASGTYQVLTRFDNVVTALTFLVPDAD